MSRSERLFRIVQELEGGRVVTAAQLAAELEVSERTIYRDVRDLVRSGVPIEGAAGVGYALVASDGLPPVTFGEDELAALVLGARMVESFGGAELAAHARRALVRIGSKLTPKQRERMHDVRLFAPAMYVDEAMTRHLEPLRRAIESARKVRLEYRAADGSISERVLRPLGLAFWGRSWTLSAWCELRRDFRTFRPDRIQSLVVLEQAIPDEPDKSWEAYLDLMARRGSGREGDGASSP